MEAESITQTMNKPPDKQFRSCIAAFDSPHYSATLFTHSSSDLPAGRVTDPVCFKKAAR
jgi:hypothetical protein